MSTLISMDVQAHGSRAEVMGLLGGEAGAGAVTLRAYRPAAAAAGKTHCDMDPGNLHKLSCPRDYEITLFWMK